MQASQSLKVVIASLVFCTIAILIPATSHALEPVRVFHFTELDSNQSQQQQPAELNKYAISTSNFGFIKNEQKLFFGYGCLTYDITAKELKCTLPKPLAYATISQDGRFILACLPDEKPIYLDTLTSKTIVPKICLDGSERGLVSHPNGTAWTLYASINLKNEPVIVQRINVFTGKHKSSAADRDYDYHYYSFSGDGRYIVMTYPFRLIEAGTMKWLPIESEFSYKKQSSVYFSGAIVPSHDVSMIAADYVFSEEVEPDPKKQKALVIWDRKKKAFLWKKIGISTPIAFSPNSRYLMIKGAVWDWKADKQIASGILGDVGKFSVDGHLLITRDSNAFYLYRLPI